MANNKATYYNEDNGDFSNVAHSSAQEKIYPLIFDNKKLDFSDDTLLEHGKRGEVLDCEMGIDRIVKVHSSFKRPFLMTVQERFRRPKYSRYKDITVTEWNHESDSPSELFKLTANYFLYGYYDEYNNEFADALFINIPDLLTCIINDDINYDRNFNSKNQSFLSIKYKELYQNNLISFRLKDLDK